MNFQYVCAKIVTRFLDDPNMATIEASLARQARAKPKEVYRVIIRVEGDLDTRQEQLENLGFTISRRLKLIRGFGSTAPGTCIKRAQKQDWIISIEPDGEVRTMKDKKEV